MTYARKMTPRMELLIGHLVPRINDLKPGQSILIRGRDPVHLQQVRNQLYGYFSLFNLKRKFSTRRETAETLRVLCLETLPAEIIQEVPFTPTEHFVREFLLDCSTEHEARNELQIALGKGLINEEDIVPILDEFRRKVLQ